VVVAGWVNRQQVIAPDYLKAENRMLRELSSAIIGSAAMRKSVTRSCGMITV
jgi:hypothetical protein